MNVLQPFQMLPFSKSIESQFRFRKDSLNNLCDIPVIPQGKFVPFAIIADSDDVGQISIHCYDEPHSYIRSQAFTKNDCVNGYGTEVVFNKIYYSTVSPEDAYNKAMTDPLFLTEGQEYANLNGSCVAGIPDFYDQYNDISELENYSDGKNIDPQFNNVTISLTGGKLIFDEVAGGGQGVLVIRQYAKEFVQLNRQYKISFDLVYSSAPTLLRFSGSWSPIPAIVTGLPQHYEFTVEAIYNTDNFWIDAINFAGLVHLEIDNLKLETI